MSWNSNTCNAPPLTASFSFCPIPFNQTPLLSLSSLSRDTTVQEFTIHHWKPLGPPFSLCSKIWGGEFQISGYHKKYFRIHDKAYTYIILYAFPCIWDSIIHFVIPTDLKFFQFFSCWFIYHFNRSSFVPSNAFSNSLLDGYIALNLRCFISDSMRESII